MKTKTQFALLTVALFLVSVNLRPAITSVAPLIETIKNELNMTNFSVSLFTAIPVICMGVFAPFASKVGDRFGISRVIAFCLIMLGVATTLRIVANTSWLLLITAAIIGIGIAFMSPLLSGFIKLAFPNHVATMIGIYSVGIGLGSSLGAGLTIPFQNMFKGSWTAALSAWAILAGLALFFWWYALSKMPSQEKKASSGADSSLAAIPWTNYRAWLNTFFLSIQACLYYSVITWFPGIALDRGLTLLQAGAVATVFTFVQMAFSLIIPLLVNRYPSRRFWLICCSLIKFAGFLLIILFPSSTMLWISAVVVAVGSGGTFSIALILPLDETSTPQEASAWTAMVQAGGFGLGGFGPTIVGWLRDTTNSYHVALIGLAMLCILMAVIGYKIGKRKRPTEIVEGV